MKNTHLFIFCIYIFSTIGCSKEKLNLDQIEIEPPILTSTTRNNYFEDNIPSMIISKNDTLLIKTNSEDLIEKITFKSFNNIIYDIIYDQNHEIRIQRTFFDKNNVILQTKEYNYFNTDSLNRISTSNFSDRNLKFKYNNYNHIDSIFKTDKNNNTKLAFELTYDDQENLVKISKLWDCVRFYKYGTIPNPFQNSLNKRIFGLFLYEYRDLNSQINYTLELMLIPSKNIVKQFSFTDLQGCDVTWNVYNLQYQYDKKGRVSKILVFQGGINGPIVVSDFYYKN